MPPGRLQARRDRKVTHLPRRHQQGELHARQRQGKSARLDPLPPGNGRLQPVPSRACEVPELLPGLSRRRPRLQGALTSGFTRCVTGHRARPAGCFGLRGAFSCCLSVGLFPVGKRSKHSAPGRTPKIVKSTEARLGPGRAKWIQKVGRRAPRLHPPPIRNQADRAAQERAPDVSSRA